jgi:hypothetical protein
VSPAAARGTSAPARSSAGLERIVALALGAMIAVLGIAWIDVLRAQTPKPPAEFDWQNPLLLAQPGQCVEVGDSSSPGNESWLVVRSPGVVQRPFEGARSIPGWTHAQFPDTRNLPPYLLCDSKRPPTAGEPTGLPADKGSPFVFPLNGFGMPVESVVVLRDIMPSTVTWNGQTRKGYAVGLYRYDSQWNGPWVVYTSKDAPVLGTMRREYAPRASQRNVQSFRVPESCK